MVGAGRPIGRAGGDDVAVGVNGRDGVADVAGLGLKRVQSFFVAEEIVGGFGGDRQMIVGAGDSEKGPSVISHCPFTPQRTKHLQTGLRADVDGDGLAFVGIEQA